MKFITLILIVGMSFILNATPSNKLIYAICKVESNNGMYVVGDNGKAIGCLQIWKNVVDDVSCCGIIFSVADMLDYPL